MLFNSIGGASLRQRKSRWLSSTIIATFVISSCGAAVAQEKSDQQAAPQPAPMQPNSNLPPVTITQPNQRSSKSKPTGEDNSARRANRQPPKPVQAQQAPSTSAAPPPTTPSPNLDAVANSATRLGLTVRETPASVDVVNQQTIQDQGYRTNVDIAQGAVGVTAIDVGGAPAGFSMRGFTFDQINILYNGISLGPQDLTGRVMSSFMFDQVEFLKGASALESGQGAIGGSVNYVSKQPISGPVQNEAFVSIDSLRSIRSGYDSTGSTPIAGLDYRFTIGLDHVNSFIDDDHKDIANLATRFNYQNSDVFKSWIAFEYYKDTGQAYFGTPLVPTSALGVVPTHGIVSGSMTTNFGSLFSGPVTVDSRTLTTNYNVLDNVNNAAQYWLRGGYEWELAPGLTFKNQTYGYLADRTFQNAESYKFDPTTDDIERNRFFVSHNQQLVGDIANLTWDNKVFGMDNRFAAELAASHNRIVFKESTTTNASPTDHVSLVNPSRGTFGSPGVQPTQTQVSVFDTVSESFEDRLKITPTFALIGGVRIDEISIFRDGSIDSTGVIEPGFPFSHAWAPVSYRAGYTWEAIPKMTFYSLYATSYDPATEPIAELGPGQPLALTSSRIYETGVKQSLWNDKVEWTLAAYDLDRRNVYEQISFTPPEFAIAGEIETRGIEAGAAIKPVEGAKVWGNIAFTRARFLNDLVQDNNGNVESFAGNTPPDVSPIIANAGASYRFEKQDWYGWLPVEVGASMRYVGDRYIFDDNAITMNAYMTADAYLFIDFDKPSLWPEINKARLTFRVRNLTNTLYAAYADPGLQDQVLLGAPRTYEAALSLKW
jgi:iron complex outermembrane recepter protein